MTSARQPCKIDGSTGFDVRPLSPGFGLEVVGLDLTRPISPGVAQRIRRTWLEAGLLLFRGIGTSAERLLTLSRCFGELEVHPIPAFREVGYPELIRLGNEEKVTGSVYEFDGVPTCGRIPWHTDLAFRVRPNAGAVLRMVRTPRHGGQTGWLDMAAAHDALDEDLRRRIAGREALYVFRADIDQMRFNRQAGRKLVDGKADYGSFEPVVTPLASPHPETGRMVLNLSTLNIERVLGMDETQSDALIEQLLAHAMQARFMYMHEWEENDIVAWDNRRTMHCAMGHPVSEVRVVQRSTIRGTADLGRLLDEAEEGTA